MYKISREYMNVGILSESPNALARFEAWLSEYKREIHWDVLFCNKDRKAPEVDFYDLPFEFQYGVMMTYFSNMYNETKDEYKRYCMDALEQVRQSFIQDEGKEEDVSDFM